MTSNTVFIVSHKRSGTHWTIDTIRHNCSVVNHKFLDLERILPGKRNQMDLEQLKLFLSPERATVLIKTHRTSDIMYPEKYIIPDKSLSQFIQYLFNTSKILYVIRDGRDVMVSLYYFSKYLYLRSQNFKTNYYISFSEFLKSENNYYRLGKMTIIEYWKLHLKSWLTKDNISIIRYEDLHSDYEGTLQKIADYLGLQKNHNIHRVEFLSL